MTGSSGQRWVRALALLNKKMVIFGFVLALFSSVISAAEPMIWRLLLDMFSSHQVPVGWTPSAVVLAIAGSLLMLYLVKELVVRKSNCLSWCLRLDTERLLWDKCARALYELPLEAHEQTGVGEFATRLYRGIQTLERVLFDLALTVVPNGLYLVCTIAFMLTMNGALTAIACSFAAVPAILGVCVSGRKARREAKLNDQFEALYNRLFTGIWLIKVVKAFGRERAEHRRFVEGVHSAADLTQAGVNSDSWVDFGKNIAVAVGRIAILAYGGMLVLKGEISVGTLAAFYAYSGGLFQPMLALASMVEEVRKASVHLERVFDIIDTPDGVEDMPDAHQLAETKGVLSFEAVSVQRGQQRVLADMSFTAHPGRLLAIVGEFGCGKSTLIGLAMRFCDPDAGRVTLDGYDLRSLPRDWLRGNTVGLVQGTLLWNDTIRANIGFGRPEATDEEIMAAARSAGAHNFIMEKEGQYDYSAGEGGNRLSAGQCQLIALSRLLLADPQVVILDEVTSHLDPATEDLVRQTIDGLVRNGKTVIVIAHRLSSIRNAHSILVMRNGGIIAQGSHEELLSDKDGIYADFIAKQTLA